MNDKSEGALKESVEAVIKSIRPLLTLEGAAVELIDVKDQEVFVRLIGQSDLPPSSTLSLRSAIDRALTTTIPQVERVVYV